MAKAWLAKEIYLTANDKAGVLAKWTGALAEAKINVWGCCGWTEGGKARFAFVTNNNAKALSLLKDAGYTTEEHDAVAVEIEDKPGTLWDIGQKLSKAGINGKYMYVSTCGGCPKTRALISTTNNAKAVEVLG